MKARPQRDWAERTAERVLSNDKLSLGFGSSVPKDIAALAKLLRRAEKRGYQRGKQDGYAEALEYNAPDDGAGAG